MFGPRIILFVSVLLALQTFVYLQFAKYLKTTKFYKPSHRWWAAVPFLVFNLPFVVISLAFRDHFDPPDWFRHTGVMAFYVWIAATFFMAQWLLIGKLIKLPFKIPIWILKIFKPT